MFFCSALCLPPPLQAVLVHQLSRHSSQNPFRKNRGRVQRVAFHPLKPFFFVATQNAVRIYNLAKQVRMCEHKQRWLSCCCFCTLHE
jgi:hypothetical protein